MSASELLTFTAELFFILLGIITVVDFLRYRDKPRRDIALVFGSLGFNFAVVIFLHITQLQLLWLSRMSRLMLVAQPYLLIRIVQYFRPVPRFVHRIGWIGLGVSWVLFGLFDSLPPAITLIIVAYFVGLNGYAAFGFIRGALTTSGVIRQRLRFAAGGASLLALLLILLVLITIPGLRDWLVSPALLVAMGSALAFYLGFAPPRWLRRTWQLNELQRFLLGINARPRGERLSMTETLHRLCLVANQTVGGMATVMLQRDEINGQWMFHNPLEAPKLAGVDLQQLQWSNAVDQVWQTRQPLALQPVPVQPALSRREADQQLLEQTGVGMILIVPMITNEGIRGILLTLLRYNSLFLDDDLSLLSLLAQQSALVLENEALVEELRKYNLDLEQKTAQLGTANQELEAFSYSVSHDLRGPLRAINGFGRILQDEYGEQFSEGTRRYLNLICDNARQMGQLIDDLLTFSRLSRQPLKREPVAMGELVRQVFQQLYTDQDVRQVEFVLADLPTCQVDPTLMTQVFVNLLSNALKYTGKCQTAQIEVGFQRQQDVPVFFVKDNGAGFDMRYADKLFGVFQRLHRVDEFEGTGVGLAIVQRIIHRHGGTIWAEAAVNQGAAFYFTLALAFEPGATVYAHAS